MPSLSRSLSFSLSLPPSFSVSFCLGLCLPLLLEQKFSRGGRIGRLCVRALQLQLHSSSDVWEPVAAFRADLLRVVADKLKGLIEKERG